MSIALARTSTGEAPPAPVFIDHAVIVITIAKPGEDDMATVTLTWTPPTLRTPDPVTGIAKPLSPDEIAGADIFDTAASPPVPGNLIGSVVGAAGTFTTGVLSVDTHNFTVITRDTTGHSAASSNVFTATIVATTQNPAAITDLAGTINP